MSLASEHLSSSSFDQNLISSRWSFFNCEIGGLCIHLFCTRHHIITGTQRWIRQDPCPSCDSQSSGGDAKPASDSLVWTVKIVVAPLRELLPLPGRLENAWEQGPNLVIALPCFQGSNVCERATWSNYYYYYYYYPLISQVQILSFQTFIWK